MSEEIVSSGHDATVLKEMIVAVAVEEIDRGETMTQATVVQTMIVAAARQNEDVVAVSDDMMTMTTDEAVGVRNDEQALLVQLLQGNGMEVNCEEQKDVEESMREMECKKGVCRAKQRRWRIVWYKPKKGKWWRLGEKVVL